MAEETNADLEFVEYVVKSIVSQPDQVKVERKVDELGVLISLEIAKEDMGTVIGKNGQTAKAIRTLLRVIGAKTNARVNMKIIEPEGEEGPPAKPAETEETEEAVDTDEAVNTDDL